MTTALLLNGKRLRFRDIDSALDRTETREDIAFIFEVDDRGAVEIWHATDPDGDWLPAPLDDPFVCKEVAVGMAHLLNRKA